MVQVINQYNDPKFGIQKNQDWSLSFILSKWTRDFNSHHIHRWNAVNMRQTISAEYGWMRQEIIWKLVNGWTRKTFMIYNQILPHQDYPQDLSTY